MNLNELIDELAKLSRMALYGLVLLTLVFCITGYLSNSLTIGSMAIENGFSIIVQLFAYNSIRLMKSADPIRFPHGTGKLENFYGFFYGALTVPIGCYILFQAVRHLLMPEHEVTFSITQVPLIPSLLFNIYVYRTAIRLTSRFESPLLESYAIDYRVAVWFDFFVIIAMLIGLILTITGSSGIAVYIDPAFSLLIALFMLHSAGGQLLKNFRVLIDLPMPEEEQIEIMRVLAQEFDAYEQLGAIRTRRSGTQRFVEIEMFFNPDVDVKSINALSHRMQNMLGARLKGVKLNIVVLELAPAA